MKTIAFSAACLCLLASFAPAQSSAPLTLQRTIALAGVSGKFDHFAIDAAGNRLFAAATGDQSVEIVDLATDKTVESLKGFGKPHGVAWIPATGRLFVADGGKGTLAIFEGTPLKLIKTIPLSEDADDMVYDATTKLLYVGHGGTNAANPARIAVIDTQSMSLVANLPVGSHPEALEADLAGDRIFANIADEGRIAVIDGKTHALSSTWALSHGKGNTPLAYDAEDNLLLVGCRTPAQLLVLNGKTGEEIAKAPTSAGADDLFYEASTRRVYLIAGSGNVDSFSLGPSGSLQPIAITHTTSGAKTGLLSPARGELYVGIPGTTTPSTINVYRTHAK